MIKLISTFVLALSLCSAYAQGYIPMPDSNAMWMIGAGLRNAYPNHPIATCDSPLSFGSDTTINGVVYHTLYGQTVCNWRNEYMSQPPPGTITSGTDYYPITLQCIFRQDIPGKKVYQYIPNENKDTLLYDFSNLVVGQPYPVTILSPAYMQLKVQNHQGLLIGGNIHNSWQVGTDEYPNIVTVVEGIGSTQGFHTGFLVSQFGIPFESMYYLHCFVRNDTTLFSDWPSHFYQLPFPSVDNCSRELSVDEPGKNRIAVYPNPVATNLFIESEKQVEGVSIMDIHGRVVFQRNHIDDIVLTADVSSFAPGYYLVNITDKAGKRSVAKFIKSR